MRCIYKMEQGREGGSSEKMVEGADVEQRHGSNARQ